MPGRKFTAGSGYRYGFNGKENDNEVKGEGAQQDYGMRIYDSRLGKFLSVDPLTKSYPELTPYQFASCSPIVGVDLDGLELSVTNHYYKMEISGGKAKLTHLRSETHQVHDGGWLGIRNFLEGSGNPVNYWAVRDGKVVGLNGWMSAGSLEQLQRCADFTAKVESGDEEALQEKQLQDVGYAVSYGILAKGLGAFGGMFQKQTPFKIANQQAAAANSGKLGGRSIIVDENLSPKLVTELKARGYNVKTFEKGTLDADIITYAEKNNAIVLTNNIKDFKDWGLTTIKITEKMKKVSEVPNVVNAIEKLDFKVKVDPSVIAPGKNVSLAEQ